MLHAVIDNVTSAKLGAPPHRIASYTHWLRQYLLRMRSWRWSKIKNNNS